MAEIGHGGKPTVGDTVKVWLPGETPWAECLAVHGDGTWEGRILNYLIAQRSEKQRAEVASEVGWGGGKALPSLHDFRQDDVVRWKLSDEEPRVWCPAEPPSRRV